ncbi:hypothetical protein A3D62_00650 [Candidatus Kaiserbacteria bacterium RIFCSPHIGHO2_02_FULL_49_11]|uniref:Uncharacterized protein n=1 Tax=Candidatus Kaiserbacteria bacterium RIFCSPHIGHO2_02_FULL_49_11 TaxID=1798489 RepID=A0A1F6CZM2_9BACT|nr:MAG: hypothetical protein A3D62_00650 [Candidatus Kaiserbacteria bacterium RIFCSPHIGHO2_02_FULL_49_11]
MKKEKSLDEFLHKVESMKKDGGVDLTSAEDLSIAVMNLISLEEHFFFTGMKTQKDEYLDTSGEIREIRKELLKKLMPNHEGETWCISKHLLAAVMRLIEVGTKLRSEGRGNDARDMFEKAYRVYAIFWALKLQLISAEKIQKTAHTSSHFEELVNKLANCCDE